MKNIFLDYDMHKVIESALNFMNLLENKYLN